MKTFILGGDGALGVNEETGIDSTGAPMARRWVFLTMSHAVKQYAEFSVDLRRAENAAVKGAIDAAATMTAPKG